VNSAASPTDHRHVERNSQRVHLATGSTVPPELAAGTSRYGIHSATSQQSELLTLVRRCELMNHFACRLRNTAVTAALGVVRVLCTDGTGWIVVRPSVGRCRGESCPPDVACRACRRHLSRCRCRCRCPRLTLPAVRADVTSLVAVAVAVAAARVARLTLPAVRADVTSLVAVAVAVARRKCGLPLPVESVVSPRRP